MNYNLCQRIAQLRNRLGITQSDLAKRLGVTRSSVNAWELGFATPQLKHIYEMSRIFGTTVDGILASDEQVIVDITDLSPKAQQAILNIVQLLREEKSANDNPPADDNL